MKIDQIVRVSEQGVSRPYQCIDSDGVLRWCKGNHTGLKSLMAEWVCGRIGIALGLPVPPCDILRLDPIVFEDWAKTKDANLPRLVTEANPYVFASTNVHDAADVLDVDRDLRKDNLTLLAQIYLFDELIHNTDRTDYNTNLLSNAGVHIIDHNNAFDPAFDAEVFAREHALRRFCSDAEQSVIAEFKAKMRETINEKLLENIWSQMPNAWTDLGEAVLPYERVKSILMEERE